MQCKYRNPILLGNVDVDGLRRHVEEELGLRAVRRGLRGGADEDGHDPLGFLLVGRAVRVELLLLELQRALAAARLDALHLSQF